jgi:hypothetical protein
MQEFFRNVSQELPSTAVSSKENETNEKRTKMNDEVATAGDSAPNWHEQPQWYMTKDRRAITYGARTDVADVSGR